MKKLEKKRGFTIIEVVLVLGIAGIIFMMVFIAVPQMQRSQRDARRKDDMMIFVEAVKKFQTNNRGALPDDSNNESGWGWKPDGTGNGVGFRSKYIREEFGDPRDGYYALDSEECTASASGADCPGQPTNYDVTIHVYTQAVCKEDKAVLASNPRDFAVVYRTESSGNYCFDSSS